MAQCQHPANAHKYEHDTIEALNPVCEKEILSIQLNSLKPKIKRKGKILIIKM